MDKESVSVFAEPTWAIIELMGRNVVAGLIQSVAAAGTELLRVDVPTVDDRDGYTKFYGGSAIYAITLTDEESARYAVSVTKPRAVSRWVIPTREVQKMVVHEKYPINVDVSSFVDGEDCDEDDVPF